MGALCGTALALLALLALGACASGASPGVRAAGPASPATLPAPDPAAEAATQQFDYRIGPLDTLEISVFQVDNLKQTVQVDAAGQIDFPLVGQVKAATKTPRELSAELSAKLGERYLQDPQVNVFVKEAVSQRFTVEGSVRKPGVFPVVGRLTLLQAIATAEGLADDANSKSVVVFRTVNRQRMAAVVDLQDIRTGRYSDPQVYAGDVVVVPLSKGRRTWKDIVGATPIASAAVLLGL
jgi:polysaccharide export outer membrane protein